MQMNNKIILLTLFLIVLVSTYHCQKIDEKGDKKNKTVIVTDIETIKNELKQVLSYDFELWYPLTIDSVYGGFFSDVNYKWELHGRQDKMIVTQARHVWSNSNAAVFFTANKEYLDVAEHGFQFLKNTMLDKEFGGFFNLTTREGKVIPEGREIIKHAYGNSFALYGLAAYYKSSHKKEALDLAIKTFEWFEKYSYDSELGGYFQFISKDGKAFKDGYMGTPPKDQNTMIHILESFTELYKVWPDKLLKDRLKSVLQIIRDKLVTPKGYVNLFFQNDWTPIIKSNQEQNYEFDHVSFGHDVEIAFLMLEASEVLGIENDSLTLRIAKKLVDHSIKNGFDFERGGLFDRGYYMPGDENVTIIKNTKEWWAQAEALNSFLLMSKLFPNDEIDYLQKFYLQWDYIKKYLIDHKYGGWFWGGIDIEPEQSMSNKASIWKGNYHTSRAIINCLMMLSNDCNKH